ncbi:MAG: outer membrane protein transport protein [Geothrix sp.]|uniref:OmpP1/FadL family transporter n=1 Tax=Geothrix sp. TaxID=1962974 RepID=UPI0017FC93B9|nr:outer membrane protein transport protein [Geothrix sp.]NWJ41623.1 outer membrane protein transport protein [Geothrix sp.]WIL20395.1 MAG: outer membrane protein transport protein [Geothrix sp.]
MAALPVAAQSMALPAADPVGISRSGAQVAYGYSLEAAATNPALLASLKEKGGFYLAMGLEMSSTQQSLESEQTAVRTTYFSYDRNRTLGAFGLAARLSPTLTLGLKLDEPYLRHSRLLDNAPSRYLGDGIDLSARRLEGQSAWTLSPNLSVGLGLGVARLSYDSSSVMRLNVPNDPTQPVSGSNAVNGLVEHRIGQGGDKVVPSYSLGVRWAINPRWTLGFAHQSGLKGDLGLKAEFRDAPLGFYANDGLSTAPLGASARASVLLAGSTPKAGSSTLELPSQTTFGLRHRLTPMMTWEADLRWTSASLRVPTFATVETPSGTVSAPTDLPRGRGHLGLNLSAEVELGKFWTLRGGLALDQRSVEEGSTEPLLGGSRTAAFSFGAGYKVWGGELNLGYQYRQSEDQDTSRLNGVWSWSGFRSVGTRVRMEGMGHLLALGFKKTF